jgi:uncharacterized protein with HEPN domain
MALLLMVGSSHVVAEVGAWTPGAQGSAPGMRWREVYGFGNIAVHVYLEIDLERVCEIVTDLLSPLRSASRRSLKGRASRC